MVGTEPAGPALQSARESVCASEGRGEYNAASVPVLWSARDKSHLPVPFSPLLSSNRALSLATTSIHHKTREACTCAISANHSGCHVVTLKKHVVDKFISLVKKSFDRALLETITVSLRYDAQYSLRVHVVRKWGTER